MTIIRPKSTFPLLLSSLPILIAASAAVLVSCHAANAAGMTPDQLRCEYLNSPRGIQLISPRLSWQLESTDRSETQKSYKILAADSEAKLEAGDDNLWDSGKVDSNRTLGIEYSGKALSSGETCYWKVEVWDQAGQSSTSDPALWQAGLMSKSDWTAQWINATNPLNIKVNGDTLPSSPYFRRTFSLSGKIKKATVYATSLGVYELHLNGAKVTSDVLSPGWTDYSKHIDYQTYDVTSSVHIGENAIGAIVGDGWYAGYYGFSRNRDLYGSRPRLLLQLDVEYADGRHQIVATDAHWEATTGPIIYSDLLQGEYYDARKELTGWDGASYRADNWAPVSLKDDSASNGQVDITTLVRDMVKNNSLTVTASNDIAGDPAYNTVKQLTVEYTIDGAKHSQTVPEKGTIVIPAQGEASGSLVINHAVYGAPDKVGGSPILLGAQGPPVVVTEYMPVKKITEPTPNTYILDLGQNMVGWAKIHANEPAGTKIQLRFGEVLNPDGSLYTTNLRSARATDTYICKGGGDETWEPHFTFHGFRYVEVTGITHRPDMSMVTGCVVGSDIPKTGSFTCSSALVNKIVQNIDWGQRGNFLSIPTDCPQRDERLGWMGDAQIFARTATYNRDVAAFYEKWITDVQDGQSAEGGYSDVSPRMVDLADGAPAWGDAGVIVPWTVWQAYGDRQLILNHWSSMEHWMDYITSVNPNGLWLNRRNNDFGDWLSIAADTPKEVLATAYYARDAQLMAQMARGIDHPEDAAKYDALFNKIKSAFDTAYVGADGTVHGDTQTCYVLALHFNLLPDDIKPLAAQHLADAIHAKNDHLSTGFVGVGYLCPTLSDNGLNDIAYKLLLNDTFPSWGFSVRQGATTIWERWDGYTPEHGFQDPGMNSFNHYSLGSVGEWLYRYVAGIDSDPDHPGFAHLLMHPHPGPGLTSASSTYDSVRGTVSSSWSVANGHLNWNFTVPANTTATIWVPSDGTSAVTEGGNPAKSSPGVSFLRDETGSAVYEVGSGTYQFVSTLP